MPFTPFHLGPGSLGIFVRGILDLPTFIVASVIVDLEPLAVILFGLDYPMHGFFHTFVGGTLVALVLAGAAFLVLRKVLIRMILLAALVGVWLHILLDAPLYTDMRPFWPIEANPLYGIVSPTIIYSLCGVAFLVGLAGIAYYAMKNGWRAWKG